MKKVMTILLIMALVLCFMFMMSTVAFAADGAETASPSDFFDWAMLATYAGCLVATLAVTQLLKGLWPQKWPTQILSYIIALGTLILANLFLGQLTWNIAVLCALNAVVVALAANGGYNNIKAVTTNSNQG